MKHFHHIYFGQIITIIIIIIKILLKCFVSYYKHTEVIYPSKTEQVQYCFSNNRAPLQKQQNKCVEAQQHLSLRNPGLSIIRKIKI